MKQKNTDLFSETMTITAQWLWWFFKLLVISIYLFGMALEYLLKGWNYLLKQLINYKNDD